MARVFDGNMQKMKMQCKSIDVAFVRALFSGMRRWPALRCN
jgi:hypothetical protein